VFYGTLKLKLLENVCKLSAKKTKTNEKSKKVWATQKHELINVN